MRLIIYNGRNSEGKTSVAALASIKFAEQGLKTLVVSTDTLNHLTQIFNCSESDEPTYIKANLSALDIGYRMKPNPNWEMIHNWLRNMMQWKRLNGISTTEIPIIPGINQVLHLLSLKKYLFSNQYDVAILDCDFMMEVLRLLSYPELIEGWLNKLLESNNYLLKLVRPLTKVVSKGFEIPSDEVINCGKYLMGEVLELQNLLLDQNKTSFSFVVTPNKQGVSHIKRTYIQYKMLGFHVNTLVINKILPKVLETGFFSEWYQSQLKAIKEIENHFSTLSIYKIELLDTEIKGIQMLESMNFKVDHPKETI